MPRSRCVVLFCKNNFYSTKNDPSDERVRFHRFPVDVKIREKWIKFCGRPSSWYPPRGGYVCSAHFRAEDYKRELPFSELFDKKPKAILKRYSVPSIPPPQRCLQKDERPKQNSRKRHIFKRRLRREMEVDLEENRNLVQDHESTDRDFNPNDSLKLEDEFTETSTYIAENDLELGNHVGSGATEDELANLRTMNYNLIEERKHLRASLEAEMQEKCLLMSKLKRAQEDIEFKNKILLSQQNKLTLLNKKLNLRND